MHHSNQISWEGENHELAIPYYALLYAANRHGLRYTKTGKKKRIRAKWRTHPRAWGPADSYLSRGDDYDDGVGFKVFARISQWLEKRR